MKEKKLRVKKSSLFVILGIIALIVIILIAFSVSKTKKQVIATVNGEKMYLEDINKEYTNIQKSYPLVTKDMVLNLSMNEKVLLQAAAKEGISASDEEINDLIYAMLSKNGVDMETLQARLAQNGMALKDLQNQYKKQTIIQRLIDKKITPFINATEEEAESYYNSNKNQFKSEESFTIQRLLIKKDDMAPEEASKKANEIGAKIFSHNTTNISNFDEFIANFSDDNTNGIYVIKRGMLDEAFEKVVFNLLIGEITKYPVPTPDGYNFVKLLNKTIERIPPYVEIKEDVKNKLKELRLNNEFAAYLAKLRSEAKITVNYGLLRSS
ncbi:SurA N-terminal domain-containing protein [Candidatus Woesearchaeota archaeon]|nr:SurA N-terminal domain-containing protein [Candidatus Woesearchaeota archaeon]